MRRNYFFLFTFCLLTAAMLLCGCGGGDGPGSPGSSGSEDTGIRINAVSIAKSEGPDIDVFSASSACPPGDPTEPEQLLHREDAVLTIDASVLNPSGTFDPFPASVEKCRIIYKRANEETSAPVIESWTIYPPCTIYDRVNNCSVSLIDIARKGQYWAALSEGSNLPAEYPTHYVATYKCVYKNNFGKSGDFQVEYDIWLADFLVCE